MFPPISSFFSRSLVFSSISTYCYDPIPLYLFLWTNICHDGEETRRIVSHSIGRFLGQWMNFFSLCFSFSFFFIIMSNVPCWCSFFINFIIIFLKSFFCLFFGPFIFFSMLLLFRFPSHFHMDTTCENVKRE